MIKYVIHIFLLSCKQATFFIEKKKEGQLSLIERSQLKLHLKICKYCSRYSKQSILMDTVIKKRSLNQLTNPSSLTMSEEVKALISKTLKERLK